jgi:hypothetical protein
VCTITLLLEEEQASTAALEAEAAMAALQLAPTVASSSVSPPPSSEGDTAVVSMLHAPTSGVDSRMSPDLLRGMRKSIGGDLDVDDEGFE